MSFFKQNTASKEAAVATRRPAKRTATSPENKNEGNIFEFAEGRFIQKLPIDEFYLEPIVGGLYLVTKAGNKGVAYIGTDKIRIWVEPVYEEISLNANDGKFLDIKIGGKTAKLLIPKEYLYNEDQEEEQVFENIEALKAFFTKPQQ